jgi:methyl-accepting chemotaxis protein
MLKKCKLSTRILSLGLAIVASFTLVFAWLYPTFKKNMYDAKYLKTRHIVEAGWGVVDHFARQANAGAMTETAAKAAAVAAVRHMRYETKDYFWINDTDPKMIMHPIKPALDGKDLSGVKDPNGKHLFVAMANISKEKGGGFVDYYWPKPGSPEPVPKISYVKLQPEWGWIIGSGVYTDDVEKEVFKLFSIIFAVIGLITLVGLTLSFLMARSIARPIDRIIDVLNEGAGQISSASGQISASSQSLAEGSSEQAASIEETSASLEEMSAMTRQNADNAAEADSLMKEANHVVDKANSSMDQLTRSMGEISQASEETSKIIKTIDEIAFQTNLLALNAAVEAARAGEAGAGFAVVADEVRNLAMRAADSARDTAELIEGTVIKVNDGSSLVGRTNEEFTRVAGSSRKVGELVAEIAAASSEQAEGIGQVSTAVSEMDRVTQQNAASAEESASASEEMNAQADQLKWMVGELMVVVGGSRGRITEGAHGHQPSAVATAEAPATVRKPVVKNERRPETVIPLDDDFQDF